MSLPYIKLFVVDFKADTAHLSRLELGVYFSMIMEAWGMPRCTLPNDPAWIFNKIATRKDSEAELTKAIETVISEFWKVKRGRLVNTRLKAEWDAANGKVKAKKESGSRGGVAKLRKRKEKSSSEIQLSPPYPELEPELYNTPFNSPLPDKEVFDSEFSRLLSKIENTVPKSRLKVFELRMEFAQECKRHDPAKIVSAMIAYYDDVKKDDKRFITGPHKVLKEGTYQNYFNATVSLPFHVMRELYHQRDMGEITQEEMDQEVDRLKAEAAA